MIHRIPAGRRVSPGRTKPFGRRGRPLIVLLGWVLLGIFVGLEPAPLQAEAATVSREYQIKSAFLFNFTKFIEWPAERFAAEDSPIVIGVFRRNPFGDQLEEAVRGRMVADRGFEVRVVQSQAEMEGVHLLFVASGEERGLGGAMPGLHERGVLTVGESPAFRSMGGIITFSLDAGRVRFWINRTTAEPTGIRFSSQLLQLALPSS